MLGYRLLTRKNWFLWFIRIFMFFWGCLCNLFLFWDLHNTPKILEGYHRLSLDQSYVITIKHKALLCLQNMEAYCKRAWWIIYCTEISAMHDICFMDFPSTWKDVTEFILVAEIHCVLLSTSKVIHSPHYVICKRSCVSIKNVCKSLSKFY